ncbi:DoxX family protein [Chryseolinea sp. H1M3-3]|uniref:DoxX family protein n=1 Tax=Chryseolinea sp. H1M3-3 TaxID=3034144 RepID=UPI0023EC87EF|nr:DoxX family protein [Chryseolinea sp. H1M3-3]
MTILSKLEQQYEEAKRNKWLRYFAIFCRITLALGFIPSGIVKIMGERFTDLSANHPLGQYFDALHLTGYYYTFIGVVQVIAALLLLIPRTALLGALIYFPIILNICILAYAVRFEGTRITTLMVLANLYLLAWNYDRLKYILPFKQFKDNSTTKKIALSNKFPFVFFGCVLATVASVILINHFLYNIRPGNSVLECTNSCINSEYPNACGDFCDCIYNQGKPLDTCLSEYEKAKEQHQ